MLINKSIIIHSNYRPDNHGGVEAVVSQLIEALGSLDCRVICFCGHAESSGKILHKGQEVIFRRIVTKIAGAPLLSFGNTLLLWHARKVNLIIYQEPFPMLWPAMLIIRQLFRIPIVVLVHADPVAPNAIKRAYSWLRSLVFRGAICVTTSPNIMNKVSSMAYSKAMVIPLGIPGDAPITRHGLELPQRYVLYFGRLSSYKGIPYLLECVRNLPNVNFVIAGTGPLAIKIHFYIADRKIKNLTFINRPLTEEQKNELISRCDFLVFPSTNTNEAFGIVQLEAMRSAKAIINTWVDSGVNYVAPHEVCALTVRAQDAEELSSAIQCLWANPELCQTLGIAGKNRYISLFTEEKFNGEWKILIKEILGE